MNQGSTTPKWPKKREQDRRQHTVLLGIGEVESQVVQVLQDLLQGQLGQLAARAPEAVWGGRESNTPHSTGVPLYVRGSPKAPRAREGSGGVVLY